MWRICMLVVFLSVCLLSTARAGECCADATKIPNVAGGGVGEDCSRRIAEKKARANAAAVVCVGANKPACTDRPCSKDGRVCGVVVSAERVAGVFFQIDTLECGKKPNGEKKLGWHVAISAFQWTCGCACGPAKPDWESSLE
jgi:hypothetical protein